MWNWSIGPFIHLIDQLFNQSSNMKYEQQLVIIMINQVINHGNLW
jgi:hypothetical protein